MRWILALLFCLISWSASAQAIQKCGNTQTPCWTTAARPATPSMGTFGYNTDTDIPEFYNGTTWMGASDGTVNVRAFGAKGDAATDDITSINNAIAFAHTLGISAFRPVKILFPPGTYQISSSINMTGWSQLSIANNGPAVTFEGYGAVIRTVATFANGTPLIDAMGSYSVRWLGFMLFTGCAPGFVPTTGIQTGRILVGVSSAGNHVFTDVSIWGCFSLAAMYNNASEEDIYLNLKIKMFNVPASPTGTPSNASGPYAVIMDGTNHWNIQSQFVTVNVTPGTHQSFVDNKFIGGELISVPTGTAAPLWISSDAEQLRFFGTYANTQSAGLFCAYINFESASSLQSAIWDFDLHCEGPASPNNMTSVFKFGGAYNAAFGPIHGFKYREAGMFGLSIFGIDSTSALFAQGVEIQNMDIYAERRGLAVTQTVFDDPTKFRATGQYFTADVGTGLVWNRPSSWAGCVTQVLVQDCSVMSSLVNALPTCNTAIGGILIYQGVRRFVTNNATGAAYRGAVTNGGGLIGMVFCDGTNWLQD